MEGNAADEPVLAERNEEAALEAAEPRAYLFDGWGMTPLQF